MTRYEENLERLNDYVNLNDGWLGGDGKKINTDAIESAKNILSLLKTEEDLSVFPMPNSGVQIEYFNENENRDYEIEIYENSMSINSYEATRNTGV